MWFFLNTSQKKKTHCEKVIRNIYFILFLKKGIVLYVNWVLFIFCSFFFLIWCYNVYLLFLILKGDITDEKWYLRHWLQYTSLPHLH